MSRFGWAYVNDILTGSSAGGPANSIQFNSGSNALTGSSNFTFDSTTSTVYLTGTLRADTLIVSASQILKSGSTIFGDSAGDTHQFTGSVYVSSDLSASSALSVGLTSTFGGTATITNGNLIVSNGTVSASSNIQGGGTLTIAGTTTLSSSADIYGLTQVRNNSLNVLTGSTTKISFDTSGNMSGSGQLQIGTDITLGNNLTMNGPLFVSNGEIRVKDQTIKTTDIVGTTTKAYLDQTGDISGSGDFFIAVDATIGNDAIITGAIRGSGAFKAAYTAYTASYTVAKTDYFMAISGTTAVTASLQAASNYYAGQKLIFKDTSGGAAGAGKNIRISPTGGNNIDGGGDIIINSNFGFKTLICDGVSKFYTVG